MLNGERPRKPENASAIGLSDLLWNFAQRCWDGKIELRPEAGEVVTCLGEVAADWDGLMPPCSPAGDAALDSGEPVSGSEEPSEFDVLILLDVTH